MATGIQWTDETWNPVTGCTKVSAGCKHCYAETVADRFWATQYPPLITGGGPGGSALTDLARPRQFTDVRCHEDRLDQPLRWKRGRKIFVNSMSDLFHEDVPDAFIDRVFAVMGLAHQHTFQVLTKRADRMRAYMERVTASTRMPEYRDWPQLLEAQMPWLAERLGADRMQALCEIPDVSNEWPHPNVWLGVSVEDQTRVDERIPLLLQTPAAVRFISAEPLLGPVDLEAFLGYGECRGDDCVGSIRRFPLASWPLNGKGVRQCGCGSTAVAEDRGLDWVIVGGESGQGARPFDVAWARSIVRQCLAAGVPVFVKQLGTAFAIDRANWGTARRHDCKGGDISEWPDDLRVREFPLPLEGSRDGR